MSENMQKKEQKNMSKMLILVPFLIVISYVLILFRIISGDLYFNMYLVTSNIYSFVVGIIMYKVLKSFKGNESVSTKAMLQDGNTNSRLVFGFFLVSLVILLSLPIVNVALYLGII